MAKRKRLTPARTGVFDMTDLAPEGGAGGQQGGRASPSRPPIAQVTGDSAMSAALQDVTAAMARARDEGRMVLNLPLAAVKADHIERDRIDADPEAQAGLVASIRARGQQAPIEVEALEVPGHYGLISGWRRLAALRHLHDETGEARFATVQALLRRPASPSDLYLAMVEENEIRADLSFYERARIVVLAVELGVFQTEKQALQTMFSAASYSRRSKIKSFIPIVEQLSGALRFPAAISEKSGLALTRALGGDPGARGRIAAALTESAPETPAAEAEVLRAALAAEAARGKAGSERSAAPRKAEDMATDFGPNLRLQGGTGRVVLEGAAVDAAFLGRLRDWLSGIGGAH